MSQYKTGTVSVTNGSAVVTGSGTAWLTYVHVGDSFKIKSENAVYSIASVDSDNQITLTTNYVGVTASDLEYQIVVDFTPSLELPEIWAGDIDWPYHLTVGLRRIDTLFSGLVNTTKMPCRVASTGDMAATYNSTSLTLTANANGAISVDGISLVANDRVLVKDQSNSTENGIYFVSVVGTVSTPFVLTRATDFDTSTEVTAGVFTFIEEGTVNADTGWMLTTNNPIELDTTGLEFQIFAKAGTSEAPMTTATDPSTNTACTTAIVDTYSGIVITTTTTGNSQTMQSPTDTRAGKVFTVVNNDTSTNNVPIVANSVTFTITPGEAQSFIWDGSAWGPIDIGITAIPVPVTQGGTGLLVSGTTSQIPVGGGTTSPIVWTEATGTGSPVRATSPTISSPTISGHPTVEGVTSTGATGTGKLVFDTSPTITTPVVTYQENVKASSASLSAAEVEGSSINNYGQTANMDLTLPAAVAGMKFEVLLGTGGNNLTPTQPNTGKTIRFEPNSTNAIYLNGVSLGWGINVGTPAATKGDRIVFQTFKSGASSYDWAVSDSGLNWDIAVGAWSTTSGLNVARHYLAGCGNVNNALSFGGGNGSNLSTTEKWMKK